MRKTIHRVIATLAMSGVVLVGADLATAPSAEATSYVTGCFKHHPSGATFQYGINLQMWLDGGWHNVASQQAPLSGCVSWAIPAQLRSHPMRMSVAQRIGRAYFYGTSPYWAPAGSARHHLGTGWVYQSGRN